MSTDREFVLRASQGEKFVPTVAEKIMNEVIGETMAGEAFSIATVEELGQKIADKIKERLKGLQLPRYKYIVQVMIGEKRGQGVHALSQCVWDADVDSMAISTINQNNIWCQSTVFAVFTY